jgi:hypothetical protein
MATDHNDDGRGADRLCRRATVAAAQAEPLLRRLFAGAALAPGDSLRLAPEAGGWSRPRVGSGAELVSE